MEVQFQNSQELWLLVSEGLSECSGFTEGNSVFGILACLMGLFFGLVRGTSIMGCAMLGL